MSGTLLGRVLWPGRPASGGTCHATELMDRLDAVAGNTPGASLATCMYAEWDAGYRTCTFVGPVTHRR